ncbi:lipase family protein [Nocardia arthritidis]|uniref:lipase family protein n=1 Tax=Nocardia arthritidis TaxID=228602 RepID=UPI00142D65E8|nr:lipase family protein [Nocardia arthritidis]
MSDAERGTARRSPWLRAAAMLAAFLVLPMFSTVDGPTARAETGLTLPTDDPFYRAPDRLADAAPGTVLRTRTTAIGMVGARLPMEATQVLYRTTGERGEPTATVTTIIRPPSNSGPLRIMSYQSAYDALGAKCDPSYTLRGGGGTSTLMDAPIYAAYLAAGFTVVSTDYEGLDLAYGAGHKSGYATLDGIRAALTALGAPSSTPVGMSGFSGGSIATEFAAELAPAYSPELNIVGAALGGYPVDLTNVVSYVDGTQEWASLLPYVFQGAARGFGIDVTPYLSDYGKQLFAQVADECVPPTGPAFPGLRMQQLLRPEYPDYRTIPALAPMIEQTRMGRSGTPKTPLYLGGGNVDGIGDGVMVAGDERALAADYCRRGVAVRYTEYSGANHLAAGVMFVPAAMAFLQARFDGAQFDNGCAELTR